MSEYITTALRDNRTTRSDLLNMHIHCLSPRSPQQPSIPGLQVPACTSLASPRGLGNGTAETSVTYLALCHDLQHAALPALQTKAVTLFFQEQSFNVWSFSAWPGGLPRRRARRVIDHKAERAIVEWETIEVGGGSSNLIFIFTMFYLSPVCIFQSCFLRIYCMYDKH